MRTITLTLVPALATAGCLQTATIEGGFATQRLTSVAYDSAFEAAERALAERFEISDRDASAGIIRCAPKEFLADDAEGRALSGSLSAPHRARRVAEIRLRRDGASVEVLCKVLVQRSETEAVRMFSQDRGAYDQPTGTPADDMAGTTPEQNTVWGRGTRDRAMERQILASVREFAGGEK